MSEEEDQEKMQYYLDIGAIVLEGVDENGEFIFSISEDAKELAPELWQAHEEYVDNSLLELYKAGLVNISYDENLEATIEMSKEGYEKAKSLGLIPMDDFEE
jgi:hypothetical protein